MTALWGWDASHHDWGRGPMDIAAAVRDGISFMTHKVGEARTVTDDRFDEFYTRAKLAGVQLLGGYYVNHPGDQFVQADRFLALLDARAPGWRTGPFILQVDAERFDYMDRAPNLSEIRAFCDRLVARTQGRFRPVVYAPKWLYGDTLRGLGYPLWASQYGTNPAVPYRQAYPGDGSTRWAAYSGQTPVILQFGSRTVIGRQPTCDANAYRGTIEQLRALAYPSYASEEDEDVLTDAQNNALAEAWATAVALRDGTTVPKAGNYQGGTAAVLARLAEIATKVDGLAAQPPATLTEEQVEKIAQQLIAATDNPLGEADKPAIVSALKQALREGAVEA